MSAMMPKVAYLVDFLRTIQAGSESQLAALIRSLSALGRHPNLISIQPSPFLASEAAAAFPGVGIKVLGGSQDVSKSGKAFWGLYRHLRRIRPDIVHSFFPVSNSIGVVIARLAGVRCIIGSRRDMGYSLTARDVSLLKVGNRFVSRIVANAEAVRVAAIAREGVPERKIQVIYNGIQLPAETATRAAPAQTPVVGIVANLNRPVKRVDVFIEAAARVRQKAPPAEFWVVGDGDLRHGLELLARELGIADSVRFLGRRPDVHNLLRRFSVGVLSSDSEGLSNSLIEYMAAALPVVATNVGGNAEVVEDGKTGLLVPPGSPGGVAEAIVSILNDPVRGAAMGDAGRARARERFSLETMFAKTLALYEETAGCSAGNGGSTAGRAAPGSGNR